jgi:murein DD-endopeptidase MepM/ murein hydrolase activator NlpD
MKSIKTKRKKAGRRNIWKRIFYKYRLSVINKDELREVFSMNVTQFRLLLFLAIIAFLASSISIAIYKQTPKQRSATYQDYIMRQQIVDEALRLDSLEHIVELQNRYITNVQDIFTGRVNVDTVYSVDSITRKRSEQLMGSTEREKAFNSQFEDNERYNITTPTQSINGLQTLNMFRPTSGIVTEKYNNQMRHYGVDIAANPNESVVAILDGTVFISTYTAEAGFIIGIHHSGDVISVYKHCESLLKKAGDRVKQGDVIALVGKAGTADSSNPHLHFELWYEGQPLDPEKYILF